MNATSDLNRGQILYLGLEGYEGEYSEIISKITGYDVDEQKYVVDDIKVVYSNRNEYDIVEDYKVRIKARYKTIEEVKEAMPHLFL